MLVSYGIWIPVLQNLYGFEKLSLQRLNKFFYNVAVSRIQMLVRTIDEPIENFISVSSKENSKKVMIIHKELT